ncbi:MAG: hypothetical protein B6229_06170 [Spirochaetaceae bacterium 4572_7]|nr:MAG: hypothetical protein B6229_06170 [Spirochaetaceae bacterium 4572_7]
MLEHQKNKLSERYAEHTLKLEPFLLGLSGYNPKETRLKIQKYMLHCAPATFSLESCQLLLFLGNNEVEFFKNYEKKLVSLTLSFDATYFDKPVSFFLKGKFESLKMMRENVYILNFSHTTSSDTYRELFLYLSEISTIYKKLFNSKLTDEQVSGLKKVPIYRVDISKDSQFICNGVLAHLSTKYLEIDLGQANATLDMNEIYNYTIVYNSKIIKLTGKVVKNQENKYISSLAYNIELVYILSKYMKMPQFNKSKNTEKLEELEEL